MSIALLVSEDGEPPEEQAREPLPRITREGDELRAGGRRFTAFGFNYGCGAQLSQTLAFFNHPNRGCRARFRTHLERTKELGANTLRVYLELFDFVRRRDGGVKPRRKGIRGLSFVLDEAERQGIYLDLTGNLVWAKSRGWYDALPARDRWQVQARFWRRIARESADSPAVLAYELTSEPVVPAKDPGSWYGGELGGYNFVQYIVRRLGDRDPRRVARSWIRRLSRAIRREDRRHLIGIGLAGFVQVGGPFGPANVADLLDVLFVHEYPGPSAAAESIDRMRKFATYGRPVIVGETAALRCDLADQEEFLLGGREYVDGYLTFFDGRRPSGVRIESSYDRFYRDNLAQFVELRSELLGETSVPRVSAAGPSRPLAAERSNAPANVTARVLAGTPEICGSRFR